MSENGLKQARALRPRKMEEEREGNFGQTSKQTIKRSGWIGVYRGRGNKANNNVI